MTTRLGAAFTEQAQSCAALGSPFMEQLCTVLAERLSPDSPIGHRLFDWPGDLGPGAESVPLRLCGALHALRMMDRGGLDRVYPPHKVDDDTLWAGIAHALDSETEFIDRFIDTPPQTNEVRRSAALIAAGHIVQDRFGLPLRLSELGASAGLNLHWDRFALRIHDTVLGPADSPIILSPDWDGPLPPKARPEVIERRGVDLNPLDPVRDGLRLRAYLWPDQPDRLRWTEAAIAMSDHVVDRADGVDWLENRLPHQAGTCHMIYTTVAWQYFPAAARARGTALIETAGRSATDRSPLAWFTMENDGTSPGAVMTLRLWPGDVTLDLGRIDFHGRWVRFNG